MSDDRRIYPMDHPVGPADSVPNWLGWAKSFAIGAVLWLGIFFVLRWVL